MSELIANLPATKVYVRKEYLKNLSEGYGEFVEGIWVSVKSIPGRAFYFETYLPEYGALYDKLPISAFVSKPILPEPDLDLPNLQFWNAMDYGVKVLKKEFIASMDIQAFSRNYGFIDGQYLFTIDNYHNDQDKADTNVSEFPEEHKSHNCILLTNGQFALYPNNRLRFLDLSLSPEELLKPDFKVSTIKYQIENGISWKRVGDSDEYFWKNSEEI